jgi:hypothetical protein
MKAANFATLKAFTTKAVMALTAVAALIFAVPATQSQAQEFAVVRTGAPYLARPGFERREEFIRREQFERREAFLRHQQWERAHHPGFYR